MSAHLVPGEVFGAYEIESELGRGGQGVVYRARQRGTERSVALKLFGEIDDDAKRARFTREAVAAARVEHPHIVPVYESGDVDGIPFIAMRLIPGPSLAEIIARFGALHPSRAMTILADIAQAVDAAHAHNLVHRDIKAANVLIDTDDTAYLTDFGVARLDDMPRLTQRGDWLGTVEYTSPEQAEGRPATARSDIYSFGVLAYEVLTGRPPFVHRQATAVLVAHVRDLPPPVNALAPDLPHGLDAVFARALAKDPAARPRSASALVGELDDVLATAVSGAARSGDTRVVGAADGAAGWTAVMRRVTGDQAVTRIARAPVLPPAPARPPHAPTPAGAAALPPNPAPRRRGRARRRLALAAAMVVIAALSAGGTLYATTLDDVDAAKARETAYKNGFHNGVSRGRSTGLAQGRKEGRAEGLKEGTAQGREAGYAAGLAEGKKVPDASPGDLRVVRVEDDGSGTYLEGTLQNDACFRIDENGDLQPLDFASPFVPC